MKKAFALLSIVIFVLLLTVTVSGHPGRTDANGGHNSEDGYHYHHGYPAHGHWDMDGDGYFDCPYNFDDQTGANSGSPGGSGGSGSSYYDPDNSNYNEGYADGYSAGERAAQKTLEESYQKRLFTEKKKAILLTLFWTVLVGVLLVLWILHVCSNDEKKKISALNQAHQQQIQKLNQEHINDTNNRILRHIVPGRTEYVHLPDGVKLNLSCVPTKGKVTSVRPFGDYTVYTSPNGKKYHFSRGCSGATTPKHLFACARSMSRCILCRSSNDINEIPTWYQEIMEDFEKSNQSQ